MDNPDLSVQLGKLCLSNPVMVASGTFGYGEEFSSFLDLKKLGALVTKTITLNPRAGNPMPRTCETPSGMLNSIGLENPGIKVFIEKKLPYLEKIGVPVIVSIASEGDPEEFIMLGRDLQKVPAVAALELNISCPNIKHGTGSGKLISQDPKATYQAVKSVRGVFKRTLITKLSPNVADIVEIAQAAEEAGSDAVSLINTLTGMSIDLKSRRPKIARVVAGLSGPAIRPVAVRMTWEVCKKVKIPVIGMGGINDAASALEFIIAGASAVSVGTANFIDPGVCAGIIEGIGAYLKQNKFKNLDQLKGSLIL